MLVFLRLQVLALILHSGVGRSHTKREMQGHLFGTANDIEVGTNLRFSRETNRQMIMMTKRQFYQNNKRNLCKNFKE